MPKLREIWKPTHVSAYFEISSLKRVRSLPRKITYNRGGKTITSTYKSKILSTKGSIVRIEGKSFNVNTLYFKAYVEHNLMNLDFILSHFKVDRNSGELFKWVNGFEGRFIISNHGRLLSVRGRNNGCKTVSGSVCSGGYMSVVLQGNGKRVYDRIHRLVCEHFVPNVHNLNVVNHKDLNKLNNHFSNLEWCTLSQNMKHAHDNGAHRDIKGENHYFSKLTRKEVVKARKMYSTGNFYFKELSMIFNISQRQIRDAIIGENWGWLSPSLSKIVSENKNKGFVFGGKIQKHYLN